MMKRIFACITMFVPLFLGGSVVFAVPYTQIQPSSYVTDQAGILNSTDKSSLDSQLTSIRTNRNAEGAVILVDTLDGQDIAGYANSLFRKIGIGDKSNNNGFLVLLAINDRKSRIEVGYGLEGVLTDLRSGRLLESAKESFRASKYGEGLSKIVSDIDGLLAGDPETAKRIDAPGSNGIKNIDWLLMIAGVVFFVLPWLGAILGRSKSWWAGGLVGAGSGVLFGLGFGWLWAGVIGVVGLSALGLIFDYIVSQNYKMGKDGVDWWAGGNNNYWFDSGRGGWGGGSGGGFGGFGGGSSGGGGSSSSW